MPAPPGTPALWNDPTSPYGNWDAWDLNTRLRIWAGYFGSVSPDWQKAIVRDWVTSHYGAMATYLDDPEIGPLLMNAATQGWDELTFNAALANTNWYKTTTGSQREWDLLSRTDPASATQKVDQLKAQIATLLSQEGLTDQFTDARITALATQLLRNGASADQIPKAVIAEVQYAPTVPVGKLGDTMNTVATKADQFLVPVSDQARFDWAKKIESGQATQEGLDEYLRQQALAQYGNNTSIVDGINRGQTVRTMIDPQVQTMAQWLEVDPESINLLDPKWAGILNYQDGNVTRLANTGEASRLVKGTSDYRQTAGANREAATMAQQLAKALGNA
jgi:hypothetical protein